MEHIYRFIEHNMAIPSITVTDIIEIIILTFVIYEVMRFIQTTRAWALFKGILVILVFIMFAALFHMNTIIWIAERTLSVMIIAVVIVFQPELRKALEEIGRKQFFKGLFEQGGLEEEDLTDRTIREIIRAAFEMGKVKTGALIVLENSVNLDEYIRTGIMVDSVISNQLLINIFEHNTPLHDGAVIVRKNRIVAATCYLPLSDNMELSKELGTRHRAGVGISDVSDSVTVIVSEETGKVSIAKEGKIIRNMNSDSLRAELELLKNIHPEEKKIGRKKIHKWKARWKQNANHEKNHK